MARYKSTYHLYSCEKAEIVKLFHLKRTYVVMNGYFKAEDLPRMIRGKDAGILEIADMKALFAEFEWTAEAEAAWERKVLIIANFYKFTRHEKLFEKLMATGHKYLIKACPSTCDCTCGIRFEFLIAMEHRKEWRRNLLGKVLMTLREYFWNFSFDTVPQHPTEKLPAVVASIDQTDDGRNHQCEECNKEA